MRAEQLVMFRDGVEARGGFDVARFVESFEVMAEAEGGTTRLRQLVLGLALHGYLAMPASPRSAPLSAAPAIRSGWRFVRVDEVASCVLGKMLDATKHTKGTKRPYLRNINVRWGACDLSDLLEMFFEDDELDRYGVRPGDVLICEGGEPGRAAVWSSVAPMLIQKAIHRVRPRADLLPDWLVLNLRHDTWSGALEKHFTGATIKHFTGKALAAYEIPLPPVAEQKRIVARVDELMRMLDDLEAKQAKKREVQGRLRAAALAALTSAEGPEELAAAWQRVMGEWEVLFDGAESVGELRRAALELAVRGKLARQSSSDQPVADLWVQVQRERGGLLEGRRRGGKGQNEHTEQMAAPYAIPSSWMWCQLGDVAGHVVDGTHHTPKYTTEGIAFISAKDVKGGRLSFDACKFISVGEFEELARRCLPKRGDLLVTKSGSIGEVAIVDTDRVFTLFESVALVPVVPSVNNRFAAHVAYLGATGKFGRENQKGVGVTHLHLVDLRRLPFPLPPLAEQHRIVAKVDHLMKLCDELEAKLKAKEQTAAKLVEAVVKDLVA